jgi:hypothetical protein
LPKLRYILASDCPRAAAASISERCDVYYPQLVGSAFEINGRFCPKAAAPGAT